MEKRVALICPWYGDNIRGGAEKECNNLAHGLAETGIPVEVFSTCVPEAASPRGENALRSGISEESGIRVRRFRVKPQDLDRYVPANLAIYNGKFSDTDEKAYIGEDINSPEMYKYIAEHSDDYSCFIFMPYLYGITINGAMVCPSKSYIIPCLHDEPYAYLKIMHTVMNSVRGLMFLSEPEKELAERLYGISGVRKILLGAQVETGWEDCCSPENFRRKYSISGPFILFAGRKDAGKKADELGRFFIRYKDENESGLKLVFAGGGELPLEIPERYRNDIIDLGFLSDEDKHDAFASAEFLCNPSRFESFSIVIMESWLAGRPVLVSEKCAVTSRFCLETDGGLYYGTYGEFAECVDFFLNNRETASRMGRNGKEYVLKNFSQERVIEKLVGFIF